MANWLDADWSAQDEERVASFMQAVAGAPATHDSRLPGADLLWWKADLLRRWETERRVTAPLDLLEPIQIATGLAAAAVMVAWALPSIVQALAFIHM